MCQTLCPAGMSGDTLGESTASMRNCRPCPHGFYGYNDDIPDGLGATACRQCVPGKYSPASINESRTGAPLCTECAGGKFAAEFATTACSNCPATTFSPPGSTVCFQCFPGSFSLGAQELCTLCAPGSYNPYNMSSQCFTCAAGTFSGVGASVCTNCSAGSFSLQGSRNCTMCEPGRSQPADGQTSCALCVPGKFATGGASSCTDCRPGNFSWGPYPLNTSQPEGRGASVCSMCPVGKFSARNGTANCSLCAAGSFGPEVMMSACRLCAGGFFTSEPGLSVCGFCTPGFFSRTNFSACRECAVGSFSAVNASANCTLCSAGFFANASGLSSCLGCAAGTFGNATGLSACLDCTPGSVSQSQAILCDECIPGSVAPRPRMTKCELCQVGHYVDQFGAAACIACPAGLSTQGLNAGLDGRPLPVPEYFNSLDACVPFCAPGTFSIWGVRPLGPGASCSLCPPGFFNPENGSTFCLPCTGGSYSRAGAALCTLCEAGKFAPAAQSVCSVCSAGKFASTAGMSACAHCGLDTFSDITGSTICTVCPSIVSDILYSTLYLRDCREACLNATGASQGGCVACEGAPLYEISLAEGTYSLAAMQDAINRQVFQRLNVNQLVHLELDVNSWSSGVRTGNASALRFYILYGGFQFLLYDPSAEPTVSECLYMAGHSDPDYYAAEMDFMCRNELIGPLLGFNGLVPPSGPTPCHESTSSFVDDGGCYSAYRTVAPKAFTNLFTRYVGSTIAEDCQDYCVEGKYSFDGLSRPSDPCLPCNGGNFSSLKGQSACRCSIFLCALRVCGSVSLARNSRIALDQPASLCAPGSFTPPTSSYPVCDLCERGKTTPDFGSTTCQFCG